MKPEKNYAFETQQYNGPDVENQFCAQTRSAVYLCPKSTVGGMAGPMR